MKSISVKNVNYAYIKNTPVIKNVSANFSSNKIHTLLGLNGSGKTTLIKILAGLLIPLNGQVLLDDADLIEIDILNRSKHIAYVRQGTTTGDDHYVKDYLSFGLMNKLSWYQSPSKEHFEKVEREAKKFNITDLLMKKMNELSGGQKQIVMICRAIIQNTDIIILDEPTSSLDFKNQNLVLKMLKEIVKNDDKTIILSTHNPNHALYLESEVVLIHDGVIVDSGSAKNIIKLDKLKFIYGNDITYSEKLKYREVTIV